MLFRHPLSIVRIRGGYIGKDGRRVPEERATLEGFAFAPGVSGEDNAHRMDVHTKGELFGPVGVDLRPSDRVELPEPYRGPWSVVGEPQQWGPNPFTGEVAGSVTELDRGAK